MYMPTSLIRPCLLSFASLLCVCPKLSLLLEWRVIGKTDWCPLFGKACRPSSHMLHLFGVGEHSCPVIVVAVVAAVPWCRRIHEVPVPWQVMAVHGL